MIELPEAINLAKQMRETVRGKTVSAVYPPSSPHKFCWFNHEPEEYQALLAGHTVTGAAGFGIFSELEFDGGVRLCFNDGVNPEGRGPSEEIPASPGIYGWVRDCIYSGHVWQYFLPFGRL